MRSEETWACAREQFGSIVKGGGDATPPPRFPMKASRYACSLLRVIPAVRGPCHAMSLALRPSMPPEPLRCTTVETGARLSLTSSQITLVALQSVDCLLDTAQPSSSNALGHARFILWKPSPPGPKVTPSFRPTLASSLKNLRSALGPGRGRGSPATRLRALGVDGLMRGMRLAKYSLV